MRLGFLVDVKGNVPVKVIARTFASGKSISSGQLFYNLCGNLLAYNINYI